MICERKFDAERWPTDGLISNAHENDFAGLFGFGEAFWRRGHLNRWARLRRLRRGRAHALDLFGSGFHLGGVTTVTGLRLRPLAASPDEARRLPAQVYGSAFDPGTWRTLNLSMAVRGIPAFDLVVMRPIGGWPGCADVGAEAERLVFVVRETLARLAPGGRFYLSLITLVDEAALRAGLTAVKPGLDARVRLRCTKSGRGLLTCLFTVPHSI